MSVLILTFILPALIPLPQPNGALVTVRAIRCPETSFLDDYDLRIAAIISQDEPAAAARAEIENIQSASTATLAAAAQKLQQAQDDAAAAMKEKDSIAVKFAEKQKEAAAAAALAEKDKAELNMKISELGAALKAAAAKEAKLTSSSKMSIATEEDKNKTIAQQSLKIMQLEGTLRHMDASFKAVESSTASLKLSLKVFLRSWCCVVYCPRCVSVVCNRFLSPQSLASLHHGITGICSCSSRRKSNATRNSKRWLRPTT
jgi:hypothetical protein